MSSDKRWVLTRVVPGSGRVLDLGGGRGELSEPISRLGYWYLNVDVVPSGPGSKVRGDAVRLPLATGSQALVLSSDTLEHFTDPRAAMCEAARVLVPGGHLVVWVPFLHPFHSDDYYRFTPLGLRWLCGEASLDVESLEAPLWVFSVIAQMVVEVLRRSVVLRRLERPIERLAAWLDRLAGGLKGSGAFAPAFLLVARKPTDPVTAS